MLLSGGLTLEQAQALEQARAAFRQARTNNNCGFFGEFAATWVTGTQNEVKYMHGIVLVQLGEVSHKVWYKVSNSCLPDLGQICHICRIWAHICYMQDLGPNLSYAWFGSNLSYAWFGSNLSYCPIWGQNGSPYNICWRRDGMPQGGSWLEQRQSQWVQLDWLVGWLVGVGLLIRGVAPESLVGWR